MTALAQLRHRTPSDCAGFFSLAFDEGRADRIAIQKECQRLRKIAAQCSSLPHDRAIQDTYPWRHKPDTAEKRSGIAILCRELAAKIADPNDRRATELMTSAWEKIADKRETKLGTKQE